ncbi:acyl-CoA dehydrogenase family protein [uncultured Sphingomonas sp.]|uniref:acyl-CoA dehydrogenase family protein n=1 Tax=uncultured Sphingomonas sp. TaxID=158754 RepID=UPI0035CAE920
MADLCADVAIACAEQGALVPARLDRFQFASYELAFAAAELLAARALVGSATAAVDRDLVPVFLAESLLSVVGRLETVAREIGRALPAWRADSWLGELLYATTAGPIDRVGEAVIRRCGDVGSIDLPEDAAMAAEAFGRFARDRVAPLAEDIHRHDLTVPETILGPMREMGLFGLSVPARYGGSAPDEGEDTIGMIAVTEALSAASLAAGGSLITRPEILTRALLAGGTERQKEAWLPRLAIGKPLCAIAITEPDFGSDVAALQLRATQVDGGWRLDGTKTWCTFAGKAGVLMVVARTGEGAGHRGLSLLLAEKPSVDGHAFDHAQDGGGRITGKAIPTIGYRGMHSFDVAFDGYVVPDANVIGEEQGLGCGFYLTMTGMTGGRIQTAARACGVMRAALDASARYVADRRVFGAALGDYQLTRVKLARMAARFAACRFMAYHVGRMLNAGGGQMEASLVKLFTCRSAEIVTREALQLHGGMGYAEESAVSRYFLDARVLSIFEGAEETLALKVVARALLQRALDGQQQEAFP